MKVIDLLNKIANGEEVPKKIFYLDKIWYWDIKAQDYVEDDKRLFNYYIVDELMDSLNDEVEIIEEDKKIKKLGHWVDVKTWVKGNDLETGLSEQSYFNKNVFYKINEIIEKLNKEE